MLRTKTIEGTVDQMKDFILKATGFSLEFYENDRDLESFIVLKKPLSEVDINYLTSEFFFRETSKVADCLELIRDYKFFQEHREVVEELKKNPELLNDLKGARRIIEALKVIKEQIKS